MLQIVRDISRFKLPGCQFPDCCDQPEVIEQHRSQFPGQPPHAAGYLLDEVPRGGDKFLQPGHVRDGFLAGFKVQVQGRQTLADVIVEVASQIAPLHLLGFDPSPRDAQQAILAVVQLFADVLQF